MSSGQTFACPSCGGTLTVQGDAAEIKCPFCDNTVVVPEALRQTQAGRSLERTFQVAGLVTIMLLLTCCFCGILSGMANTVFSLSSSLLSSPPGRKTQTPDYDETFL